jgi:acyl-CoA thioester hydrolase
MTCVRLEFTYEVVKGADGCILAMGSTSHAWTDKSLKPLNIEKKEPELCNMLKKTLE